MKYVTDNILCNNCSIKRGSHWEALKSLHKMRKNQEHSGFSITEKWESSEKPDAELGLPWQVNQTCGQVASHFLRVTQACSPVLTLRKFPFRLLLWIWSEGGSDSAQPEPILGSKRYRSALKFPFLSLITLTGSLIRAFQLPLLFYKIIYTAFYIFNKF